MSANRSFLLELIIAGAGALCGMFSAVLAMAFHVGTVEGLLSILYALLMSAMYYFWVSFTGWKKLIFYLLLCGITGYLLGLAEVTFLT